MGHSGPNEHNGEGLTPRRRQIVKVIDDSVRRNGYSPSLREIGDAVGLASTSSVSHQVLKLQELGVVSREPGRPRTILVRTTNQPFATRMAGGRTVPMTTRWPMCGTWAAGSLQGARSWRRSPPGRSSRCPGGWWGKET